MKKHLLFTFLLLGLNFLTAQIKSTGQTIKEPLRKLSFKEKIAIQKKNSSTTKTPTKKRSASNPTNCGTDTSLFTDLASTGYQMISVSSSQCIGQYFGANQEITVKGFKFYASSPVSQNVYAKIYEAGADSLPRGAAIDSVLMTLDTVTVLSFDKLARNAVFNKPVKVSKDYILTVETSASSNTPAIVTNNWTNSDGEGRNLSMVQLNGRWFRGMNLSVGGAPFDAHFQIFPFVSYSFGTDFTISNNCYLFLDSFNFNNKYKSNVSGSIYYNEYMFYEGSGFDAECHDWTFDKTNIQPKRVHGKFRPGSKKNVDVKLRSFVVPYSVNLSFCYDSTEKTMYYNPSTPSINGSPNGCIGENKTLYLNANSDIVHKWYRKANDTNSFNTGNSYTINNLSKNDTSYITATNGTCVSRTYTAIVTANQTPSQITTLNDSICSDANAILKASTDAGDILWYRSATDDIPVFTGNELQTGKLNADTTYYAEANNKGCLLASGRVAVTAFVNADFAPSKPSTNPDTSVCYSGTSFDVTISATPSANSSIRWYDMAIGGTPISSTNDYTHTVSQRGTKTLYVESWDGRCGSGRTPINIIAGSVPPTFAKIPAEICIGDSADIAASSQWGDINWYYSTSDNNSFLKGKFLRIGGLNQPKSYVYFKTSDGKCINPNFDSVEVIVNIPPTASIINAKDVCKGANGKIELQIPNGSVKWYFDNAASNAIATGTTLNIGEIYNNTTRYYETELNGCKSKRNAITIKALDKPIAGFQYQVDFPRILICNPLNTNNTEFLWTFGDGNTSDSSIGVNTYAAEGQYSVKMLVTSTLSGCQDSSIVNITINHNDVNNFLNNTRIYPNPVSAGSHINTSLPVEKAYFYDLSGRLVALVSSDSNEPHNNVFVTSNLENGTYILVLESNGIKTSHKIQIK